MPVLVYLISFQKFILILLLLKSTINSELLMINLIKQRKSEEFDINILYIVGT